MPSGRRCRSSRPLPAAANSSGARRCSAAIAQKSPPSTLALVELAGGRQPPRDLERTVPGLRPVQRRPRVRRGARERERVEDEHGPKSPAPLDRRGQQVGLDRRGDRRAVPFEQRRDRQARPTCRTVADRTRPARVGARREAAGPCGARARAARHLGRVPRSPRTSPAPAHLAPAPARPSRAKRSRAERTTSRHRRQRARGWRARRRTARRRGDRRERVAATRRPGPRGGREAARARRGAGRRRARGQPAPNTQPGDAAPQPDQPLRATPPNRSARASRRPRSPPSGASSSARQPSIAEPHARVGVGQLRFQRRAVVLDDERPRADPPQRLSRREHRDQLGFASPRDPAASASAAPGSRPGGRRCGSRRPRSSPRRFGTPANRRHRPRADRPACAGRPGS